MLVREIIYENRMYFDKQVKFLWLKWWRRFAEGGDLMKSNKGKLIDIRFKNY